MTDKWYDKTPEQTLKALGVDPKLGLPQKIALSRLKRHGANVIYPIPKGAFRTYLGHVMTDFTSILLLITAIIYALLEDSTQAGVMITLLLLNYTASIVTYVRAQRVLEGMGHFALPVAKVMRDGRLYLTGQDQLVAGDIILLSAGDIVPCDARLLECDGLCALEVNLTGVAHTVAKDAAFVDYHDIPPSAQQNMVFASTILTAGSAKAVVTAVSGDTLVCKMGKNSPIVSHEKLSVFTTLKKYCSTWSLCMIVLVFAITALDVIIGLGTRGLFEIFLSGLSLAVSSMSELYMAFGYIIVACGVWNAVKQFHDINSGALIKNSASLERLKDISYLIIPKEGVITLKRLKIESIWTCGEEYTEADPIFERKCSSILRFAVISTGLYGKAKLAKNNMTGENIYTSEEDAIIDMADRHSVYNVELDRDFPVLDHEGITEDSLFETTLSGNFEPHNKGNGIDGITDDQHYTHDGSMFLVSLRGDAIKLLDRCDTYTQDGRLIPLNDELRAKIRIGVELKIREAYRVVGIATKDTVYNNLTRIGACQSGLNFEGYLAVREPLLAGAAKNVSKLEAASVKLIMLCDDINDNNLYLAQAAGVAHNPTDILTSAKMRDMKEGLLRANVGIYRVYEGLDVAQKRQLVKYLREDGQKVGYLGKELDEIILLRESDVGFTQSVTISDKSGMGGVDLSDRNASAPIYVKTSRDSAKSGCEALKFIADVIISEGDENGGGGFNALVGSLGAAKVVYRNLMRMVRYLLTSQFARFFVVLYSVLTHQTLFTPTQILVSGLIIDFMAVIIIAFEQPSLDILSHKEDTEGQLANPIGHLTRSLLFGAMWAAAAVGAPKIAELCGFALTDSCAIGSVFVGFCVTQTVVLSEIKKDKSIFIPNVKFNTIYTVFILCLAFFIALGTLIGTVGELFGITVSGIAGWLCAMAAPLVMLGVYEVWKAISDIRNK